jgi:HSP20 family protein
MNYPMRWARGHPGRWDPFGEFDDFYRTMGRWLQQGGAELAGWSLPADVEETEQNYIVHAELPGISRENVNLQLNDRDLEISGEIPEPQRSSTVRQHTRRTGQFDYRVRLPGSVDAGAVTANLSDGVLTVTLPKSSRATGQRIEITGG